MTCNTQYLSIYEQGSYGFYDANLEDPHPVFRLWDANPRKIDGCGFLHVLDIIRMRQGLIDSVLG